jgi:chemotaxis protein MotB
LNCCCRNCRRFKDQILFEITQDGLRIQIVDAESRPMFALGSAQLQPYFEDILLALADTIKAVPNKISVSGHTDAKPYASEAGFLAAGGYGEERIARVVGYASSALFDRANPFNPVNRRIDIVVLTRKAQRNIESEGVQGESTDGARPAAPVPAESESAPLPAEQVRERLNLFEDGGLKMDQPLPE